RATSKVLVGGGAACYAAWVGGTVIGVAGGAVVGLEALAAAVFPVLFIGLASIMARGRTAIVGVVAAASLTLLLSSCGRPLGGWRRSSLRR
ncbi:MAG: hypothetical protein ACR2HQ_11100, partial [Ilumatobacteraceae bacterium]